MLRTSAKPVIFLAFANDLLNDSQKLQALAKEQDELEKALKIAKLAGLCEVIIKPNVTVDNIIDTFQTYRDRICIFHYAGHADRDHLLLEDRQKINSPLDGEAMVGFFAKQKSLQLIFLNACSTQEQAEKLIKQGVPSVIGTSKAIPDEAALILARNFYRSLGGGATLSQAWQEAQSSFKMKVGFDKFRGLSITGKDHSTQDSPWAIYYDELKKERIKKWNLGEAGGNPLFDLPLPNHYYQNLPDSPFPGLHYYTEKDAALFFGRSNWIRTLYQKLQGIHQVILFYGKSGVGKSSLLFAGLKPRIEDRYTVAYIRRDAELGLTGSLIQALRSLIEQSRAQNDQGKQAYDPEQLHEAIKALKNASDKLSAAKVNHRIDRIIKQIHLLTPSFSTTLSNDLGTLWDTANLITGKPLLLILDQVEEVFTRPRIGGKGGEVELYDFLYQIRAIFYNKKGTSTKSRLLLSFRKEYFPEIQTAFESKEVSYDNLFLQRLNRKDIMETITGVENNPSLFRKYGLKTENTEDKNLALRISNDLTRDPESPIAPILQIILRKLWDQEQAQENRDNVFSINEYNSLENTIGAFFREQLEKLKGNNRLKEAEASGLVLDVLLQHTTSLGTATSCQLPGLEVRYRIEQANLLPQLLMALEHLSLLTIISTDPYTTLLAHDVLAPVVRQAFNESENPGQRASRILNNAMQNVSYYLSKDSVLKLQEQLPESILNKIQSRLKGRYRGVDRFLSAADNIIKEVRSAYLKQHKQLDQIEKVNWVGLPYLLLQKAAASIGNKPFEANLQEIYFNIPDLKAINKGKTGMRKLTDREENLLARSSQENSKISNFLQQQLEAIEQNILYLRYAQAKELCMRILDIGTGVDRENILRKGQEIAFFYTLSGNFDEALPLLRKIYSGRNLRAEDLPELIQKADPETYSIIQSRYLPEMVVVPGGLFQMGSSQFKDTLPHKVELNTFKIANTPTTVWQYHLFLKAKGQEMPAPPAWGWRGDYPMTNIDWKDAENFSIWLRSLEALSPQDTYRLPTEAEWEYAARYGETNNSSTNALETFAWYIENTEGQAQPVKGRKANKLGLFDMLGNIKEWCMDWYSAGYYADSESTNPHGPADGLVKVLRGGSWYDDREFIHAAYRSKHYPDKKYDVFGFRLVSKTAPPIKP